MSRIYVAGPMTGYECYNAGAFRAARDWLRDQGHEVVTPLETNNDIWREVYDRDFDACNDKCDYGDLCMDGMFRADMEAILWSDTLVLLPGWQMSKGARHEAMAAMNMRRKILYMTNVTQPELTEPTQLAVIDSIVFGLMELMDSLLNEGKAVVV